MRVTRLEIFGFKSFVERFTLNFDQNMIGIVGPNGCGKSNVVDALRWVLGETHARQLRGNTLDDLIFNGSDSRKPLGMAEVSLTIRPDEGWAAALAQHISGSRAAEQPGAPQRAAETEGAKDRGSEGAEQAGGGAGETPVDEIVNEVLPTSLLDIPGIVDAAEIQLTRRLYRSGESEYFINRIPCRLRDMLDIYRLIGLGARGLSIVQQGQIGEFIAKKPVERRELLEEAAGISGIRTRIEAAQRKLERTTENMARLNDIIIEVEKQTRILKRQASQARARNDLKASLAVAEEKLFQRRAARIHLERKEHEQKLSAADERLSGEQGRLQVIEAEEEQLRCAIFEIEGELTTARSRREELQQTLARDREKIQECRIEQTRVEGKQRSLVEDAAKLERRGQAITIEADEIAKQSAAKRTRAAQLEAEKQAAESALHEIQQLSRAEAQAESRQVEGSLSPEAIARSEEIRRLSMEVEGLPQISAAVGEIQSEARSVQAEIQSRSKRLQNTRVSLAAAEAEIQSLNKQLQALAEQAARSAGSPQPVPDGMQAETEDLRILASGIAVPEDLQKAVGAILGEKGNYLVSSKAGELGRSFAARSRESSKPERRRIGVVDRSPAASSESRPLSAEELSCAPGAQRLLELVQADPGFEAPLEALLDGVLVVESLEQALALNTANKEAGRELRMIVTPAGEVVTPWGWYTTDGEGLGFSFRRRIQELDSQAQSLRGCAAGLEEEIAGQESRLHAVEGALAEQMAARESAISAQKRLQALMREEQEEERRRRDAAIREERMRREEALNRERRAQQEVQRFGVELARIRESIEYDAKKIERLGKEAEQAALEREALAQRGDELEKERAAILDRLNALSCPSETGRKQELEVEYGAVDAKIKGFEKRQAEVNERLGSASRAAGELRKVINSLTNDRSAAQLHAEKCGIEMQMLCEEMNRILAHDSGEEGAAPLFDAAKLQTMAEADGSIGRETLDADIAELSDTALRLRKRLEREGEVDPTSIERYEQESARLEQMKVQHTDLEAATKTLEKTIRQLKELSRTRFLDTFADVRGRFSELVPRLFGGGAGHLELINPEDPLTSGVEISVRPPGKRISSMDLLSGGEKALVAASVLISMFLHRPSPICVLDEVDAPLDDANLDRFNALIREIGDRTQFLIITHNKTTMSAVDRLIGITMQESGISKALSVSFEEAEREIEQWAANA